MIVTLERGERNVLPASVRSSKSRLSRSRRGTLRRRMRRGASGAAGGTTENASSTSTKAASASRAAATSMTVRAERPGAESELGLPSASRRGLGLQRKTVDSEDAIVDRQQDETEVAP